MNGELKVHVTLAEGAKLPHQGSEEAAGYDLCALEEAIVAPGQTSLVRTGVSVALPRGYEMQIRPRSGLSLKTSIRLSNSPGIVDSDYRGEVGIIVDNIGVEHITIPRGMRLAQAVFNKVEKAAFVVVERLPETERGAGGFGSTGS